MEISEGTEIIDLGLYFKKEKILALSDFHLGYEAELRKKGIFIPSYQFADTRKRLEKIFEVLKQKNKKIKTIVITGDLRHEFGAVSRQEYFDVKEILDFMKKNSKKVVLLKGNHETMHNYIKKLVPVKNYFLVKKIAFLHGDKIPTDEKVLSRKIFVIGHEHPAIKLADAVSSEKVKCFMKGKWKNRLLLVLPSFNLITEGTNVLSEKLLSPFLKNINDFEVFVVPEQNKALNFGRIRNLRQI